MTRILTHLNTQTNDLSEKMPIVVNEIRVPGLNTIPEMERGIGECIAIGNFKIALGIKIKKPEEQHVFQQVNGFDTDDVQFIIQSTTLIKHQHKKHQ